jgi:hypothetical protein
VQVPDRLLWVVEAFNALSRTRLVNEAGPQPMAFSDIKAYCDLSGIFVEGSKRDLVFFLTEMDILYLKHMHAKIQKSREEQQRKAERDAERRKRRR